MVEKTKMEVKSRVMLRNREAAGMRAYKKLLKLLSTEDVKEIEKSAREFHKNFKLG
jgi:hypothetical protein